MLFSGPSLGDSDTRVADVMTDIPVRLYCMELLVLESIASNPLSTRAYDAIYRAPFCH